MCVCVWCHVSLIVCITWSLALLSAHLKRQSPLSFFTDWLWGRNIFCHPCQTFYGFLRLFLRVHWSILVPFCGRTLKLAYFLSNGTECLSLWFSPGLQNWTGFPGALALLLLSCSVMSDSLRPYGLQHTRLSCPSPFPGACSNSCPSSQWYPPTISSFLVPLSSCL